MALERQKTFEVNLQQTIENEVENFLRNNEIDPAGVQVLIDNGRGIKEVVVTYGERDAIKEAYAKQNRDYTDADKVDYCHIKEIMGNLSDNLDDQINDFIANSNIGLISMSRYITTVNKGIIIFYFDLEAQARKAEEKKLAYEKLKEELSQKFAKEAVKDSDLETTNETVDKFSNIDLEENQQQEETTNTENENKNEEETKQPEKTKAQLKAEAKAAKKTKNN